MCNNPMPPQMGWVCPLCQSVYGPMIAQCFKCSNREVKTVISTGSGKCLCGTSIPCPMHPKDEGPS